MACETPMDTATNVKFTSKQDNITGMNTANGATTYNRLSNVGGQNAIKYSPESAKIYHD